MSGTVPGTSADLPPGLTDLFDKGAFRDAVRASDDLPPSVALHLLRGTCFRELADFAQAEDEYLRALGTPELSADPIRNAAALADLGRLYEMKARFTQSASLYQRALGIHDKNPGDPLGHARILRFRAGLHKLQGELTPAEALLAKAADLIAPLGPAGKAEAGRCALLSARLVRDRGRTLRAEELVRDALAVLRDRLGERHPDALHALHAHGRLLSSMYKLEEAHAALDRAKTLRVEILGDRHPDTGESLEGLALLALAREEYRKADDLGRKALDIAVDAYGEGHPDTALARRALAEILLADRQTEEALALNAAATEATRSVFGDDDPGLVRLLMDRAEVARQQGDLVEMLRLFREAHDLAKQAGPDADLERVTSGHELARHLMTDGRQAEAQELSKSVLELAQKTADGDPLLIAPQLLLLSRSHVMRGRIDDGEKLLTEAVALTGKLPPWHPTTVQAKLEFSLFRLGKGDLAGAEEASRAAVEATRDKLGRGHTLHTNALRAQAEIYHMVGDLEKSERIFEETLELERRHRSDDDLDRIETLRGLARLHQTRNNAGAAEVRFRQAVDLRQSVLGLQHPDVAAGLHDLANLYQQTGNMAAAEALLRQATEIRREMPGEEHRDFADSLVALAGVHHARNDLATAETLLQEALRSLKADTDEEHPRALEVRHALAVVHHQHGEHRQALALLEKALAGYEKISGAEDGSLLPILGEQVRLHTRLGDQLSSLAAQERINRIRDRLHGTESMQHAEDLVSLSDIHRSLGETGTAEKLARESVALAERLTPPGDPSLTIHLSSLANTLSARRAYAEADAVLLKARKRVESLWGPGHPLVAHLMLQQAGILAMRGKNAEATRLYTRATEQLRQAFGEDHPEHANALRAQGMHYQRTKEHALAVESFDRYRIIARRLFGADHPNLAWCLQLVAGACRDAGRLDDAEKHLRDAIDILRRGEPGHDGLHAALLHDLGVACSRRGKADEAEKMFLAALDIDAGGHEQTGGHLETLCELARLRASRGAAAEAFGHLRQLVTAYRSLAGPFACLDATAARKGLLEQCQNLSGLMLALHALPQAARPGLEVILRTKGVSEGDIVGAEREALLAAHPALADKLTRYARLGRQIAARFMQGGLEGEQIHRDLLAKWREEFDAVEDDLVAAVPEIARRRALGRLDAAKVADAVPTGGALLEFVRYAPHDLTADDRNARKGPPVFLAWVLRPGEADDVKLVPLGDAAALVAALKAGRVDALGAAGRDLPGGEIVVAIDDGLEAVDFAKVLSRRVKVVRSGRELVGLPGGTVTPAKSWWRRMLGW